MALSAIVLVLAPHVLKDADTQVTGVQQLQVKIHSMMSNDKVQVK